MLLKLLIPIHFQCFSLILIISCHFLALRKSYCVHFLKGGRGLKKCMFCTLVKMLTFLLDGS